jgi:hypothetical protein
MSGTGRPEQLEGDAVAEATPTSTELVPLAANLRWLPKVPLSRPDPGFLTQLIATAEQAPQTRLLRRATPADAQVAYGAKRQPLPGNSFRTRQVA